MSPITGRNGFSRRPAHGNTYCRLAPLSPSSPRAAKSDATLRALGLDRLARPKQEAAMP